MSYSETLTLTLPSPLADIASSIGRALDPDTGGDKSFMPIEGKDIIVCSTPCRPEFKEQALYMMEHPELLYLVVCKDYETRWPEFKPPTLEECELFCKSIYKPST